MEVRGFAGGPELGVLREEDRQLGLGDGDYSTGIAVDDGYRGSPVALSGYQPVPDSIGDRAAADALLFHGLDHSLLAFIIPKTNKLTRVDHFAGARVGLDEVFRPSPAGD